MIENENFSVIRNGNLIQNGRTASSGIKTQPATQT